jgi:hypothetical protein
MISKISKFVPLVQTVFGYTKDLTTGKLLEDAVLDFEDKISSLFGDKFKDESVMYQNFVSGWGNLTIAIALEAAFNLTCELNSDNFNMFDRLLYLSVCPIHGQMTPYSMEFYKNNPKKDKYRFKTNYKDKIGRAFTPGPAPSSFKYLIGKPKVLLLSIYLQPVDNINRIICSLQEISYGKRGPLQNRLKETFKKPLFCHLNNL